MLGDMLELQNGQVNGTSRTSQPFKIRKGAKYDPTIEAVGSSAGLVAALHLPYHYSTCPVSALIRSLPANSALLNAILMNPLKISRGAWMLGCNLILALNQAARIVLRRHVTEPQVAR